MEKIYNLSSRALALVVLCLLSISATAQDNVITTVADKGTSGKFFAKLWPKTAVAIDKDAADVYSVYTDGEKAIYCQLRIRGGKYVVKPGECAIIKTSEAKEITLEPTTSASSIVWTDLICPSANIGIEAFKAEKDVTEGKYIYMLTNLERNGGFGFTHFGGTTLKAGNFYIITTKAPSASGRLESVWVDADGNVENEATAIDAAVKEAAGDDAVYSLSGVKMTAPKAKGVYIRNGKKFIVK